MIARRAALLALVVVLAAGAGLAARELRASRVEVPTEQAGEDGQAAAAPTGTPVPKWSTRRIEIPADVAIWSMRVSPDGSAIAALSPNVSGVSICTADKTGPPVCPTPTPQRVVRFGLSDPLGAITATLKKVADAPQNGGSTWLADGGLVVVELVTTFAPGAKSAAKTVVATVIEKDGRRTPLGVLQAGAAPQLPLSPDGRWLVRGEDAPPQLRFVDRATGSSHVVAVTDAGLPADPANTPLAWSDDGRVLYANDSSVLMVGTDGRTERVAGPSGMRLYGVDSMSPDRRAALVRGSRGLNEGYSLLAGGRWVDPPTTLARPVTWLSAHELLLRTSTGQLQGYDALTGATRDLGFTMRSADPRILAYSAPYLMWRDGDAGRTHLLDVRTAYDAVVGVTGVVGVQTYAGGGFLLLHQDGAELLTGADWFARLPPTAAPFASAGPAKPGVGDPFADIKALPRLDQFTTGGALEVLSRTADAKRVRSPDGGWSLEVPAEWRADVGRLRGGEIYSFDPTGMDYGGNSPPPGGVRMSIALWPDFDRKGPAWFAENQSRPGRVTSKVITTVPLAGTTAQRVVTQEEQPGPFASTVARWYLRHPSFDDRVIEVILFRADGAALPRAEAALATLELFAPVSGPREPLLSRAEAIQKVLGGPDGKPSPSPGVAERIEAKLVTQKELELAQKSGAGYSLDADTPIWVVIRFGDFEANGRGMCCVMQVPHWAWLFTLIDARTGQGFGGGGGGPAGSEPAWWASLRDRAS